ncbi:hypothetical protein AB0C65_07555 [Nocardia sp. NPDC048505]|uniref:hypothetical protein n=1 Tax=Nocardia sp. NPDC048505 TaxID=3155756 RepID=UPI0034035283
MIFQSCCTPVDIAHLLRRRYGLPVELADNRPMLRCGTRIGAVDMPATLGRRVRTLLPAEPSVPIVSTSRDRRWTFLVEPAHPGCPDRLAPHQVVPRPSGRVVLLPVTHAGPGSYWASEPTPGPLRLPGQATVLEAARRVVDAEDTDRPGTGDANRAGSLPGSGW